jgi:hypothetical protein
MAREDGVSGAETRPRLRAHRHVHMSARGCVGDSAPSKQLFLLEPKVRDAGVRSEDAAVEVVDVDRAILATDVQERMSSRSLDAAVFRMSS